LNLTISNGFRLLTDPAPTLQFHSRSSAKAVPNSLQSAPTIANLPLAERLLGQTTVKLTKTAVDALTPRAGDYFVWDPSLPGFGIKVTPTSLRVAVFQYRQHGRSRRYTIGRLSDGLTLEQARSRAKDLAARVVNGEDPAEDKQAARKAATVLEMFESYFRSPTWLGNAPGTRSGDEARFRNHIAPLLGGKALARLTQDDVKRMRTDIAAGKTAKVLPGDKPRGRRIVTGGEGAAGQSVTLLTTAIKWAQREGLVALPINPAADVKGHVSQPRNIAPAPGDYSRIFEALAQLQEDRRFSAAAADALRLMAHTGLRRGEARGLRWRQVDFEGTRLNFAPVEHKGGLKSGVAKSIFMSAQALEIVARQPRRGPHDLVFAPASGDKGVSLNRPWNLVREKAGLAPGFILHGLRHALGATMAADGASAQQIASMLGHRQASTSERYVAWASETRAQLAARASTLIGGPK
jgi:integrase